MNDTWVKSYRKMLDNPIVCKDAEYFSVWNYLLLNATWCDYSSEFMGKSTVLKPGQLITGRKKIAEKFNISESKVQRILKRLENEHLIEQQTSNTNRLITVINWEKYQSGEQQDEQPVNNERTTSEQRVNTNKNIKKEDKGKKEKNCIYSEVFEHYLSLPLTKHKTLNGDMERAIKKALELYNNDGELLKRMLTRHAEKVGLTMDEGRYAVRPRKLGEFFGQKKVDSTMLICSDYDDGTYEQWKQVYLKQKQEREDRF